MGGNWNYRRKRGSTSISSWCSLWENEDTNITWKPSCALIPAPANNKGQREVVDTAVSINSKHRSGRAQATLCTRKKEMHSMRLLRNNESRVLIEIPELKQMEALTQCGNLRSLIPCTICVEFGMPKTWITAYLRPVIERTWLSSAGRCLDRDSIARCNELCCSSFHSGRCGQQIEKKSSTLVCWRLVSEVRNVEV